MYISSLFVVLMTDTGNHLPRLPFNHSPRHERKYFVCQGQEE